ncbi:MAG: MoxR family ATPase [Deinococcota bacterium]
MTSQTDNSTLDETAANALTLTDKLSTASDDTTLEDTAEQLLQMPPQHSSATTSTDETRAQLAARLEVLKEEVSNAASLVNNLRQEINRVIVGQETLVDRLLTALLADGHILLEGVPGLAKTLLVHTAADTIQADFKRIQFTPDLLPADLVGTQIYNPKTAEFTVHQGPIFANLILADEINRAPAKVQSALLESMQERQITIADTTYQLDPLFLVLATQNPVEQEGTYPLPEAQVDRFMLKVNVRYPSRSEERIILERMTGQSVPKASAVADTETILQTRMLVSRLHVDSKIKDYIIDIVAATRDPDALGLSQLSPLIGFGASPRASIFLLKAARGEAFLRGRAYVIPDDVKTVALDVLRHRLVLTYEADADGVTADMIINRILDHVEVP